MSIKTIVVAASLGLLSSTAWATEFHEPELLKAGDQPIAVESPGYACPTFVDIDGDDLKDLVVGQFKSGKMHAFKNTGSNEAPAFAQGDWIRVGDKIAEVPGVW